MSIFKKIKGIFKSASEVGLFQSATLRQESGRWSKAKFLKMAEISLYTNKAINVRAKKVSDIEFTIQNDKDEDINTPEAREILALLEQPNPEQTKSEFFELYQKYKDSTGSVYIELVLKERKLTEKSGVGEMRLLRPDKVEAKYDSDGVLTGYVYHKEKGGDVDYKPEQIIASHYFDPLDQKKGVSLLRAGSKAISTENQLFDYNENILRSGGKLDGILSFTAENLTKKQVDDAKKGYFEQYSDARKAGTPLFLGGDAKYQSLGLSPTELSYLESKGVTLNDICILTEVPKIMLATIDGVKFDNAKESRNMFLADVIAPLQKNLTIKLTQSNRLSGGLKISFVDPTPENVDLKLKINDNGVKNYYMTQNEARENVGLEPLSDGDVILVPFGLRPYGEEPEINNIPDDTEGDDDDKDDDKDDKKMMSKSVNKDFEHPLKDPSVRKLYGEFKVAKEIKNEKIFTRELKMYFKAQRDRIIANLDPTVNRIFRKENMTAEVFNLENEIKISAEEFLPLLTQFLKESGDDTYEMLGNSRFQFNIDANIASWLSEKADVFSRQINNTTFKRLQEEFATSLEEQETRQQLIKRIEDTYEDGGKVISKDRAGTIARTEVGSAMTRGSFEAYKQADIPIKIWVTVGDKNVRESHAIQDGEEKPINDAFSNGLKYPRESGMPAGEVINCRCQI